MSLVVEIQSFIFLVHKKKWVQEQIEVAMRVRTRFDVLSKCASFIWLQMCVSPFGEHPSFLFLGHLKVTYIVRYNIQVD